MGQPFCAARAFGLGLQAQIAAGIPRCVLAQAAMHLDGTMRLQTVRQSDEPWVHRLLLLVGELFGWPVLLNTSFNVKARPLINRISEAIEILRAGDGLRAVLVEDWLFEARQDDGRRTRS